MSLLAGLLYTPGNTDSIEYRIPRVWEWLGAEHWYWIRTLDVRMNISATGFEWLTAPLMLFTDTDRLIFLINWISYLMLPGLAYSVFVRLGVSRRVAWWWAWILSAGWCYALQASSVVNDAFAVVYALAAVDLALRAREKKSVSDLWFSLLAVGLLTGSKQTDIPLALPWLVAAWPAWRLLLQRPLATLAVMAIALLISAIPVLLIDVKQTGAWTGLGDNLGFQYDMWKMCNNAPPFWAILGNVFCLPLENLVPPYFPGTTAWGALMQRFLHTPFGSHFTGFEGFGRVPLSVSEYDAGIGLGVTLLALISIVAARRLRRPDGESTDGVIPRTGWLRWAIWLALLAFMAKVTTFFNARHLSPYYVLIFSLFLVCPGHARLVRLKWWRRTALLLMLLTVPLLVLSRSRPLFPAVAILEHLQQKYPHSPALARAWNRFSYPIWLNSERMALQKTLPREFTTIGYLTYCSGTEPDLWLPFQKRRVVRFLPGDTLQQLRTQGVTYVLVENDWLDLSKMSFETWLRQFNGTLVHHSRYEDPNGPIEIYLVKLNG